MLDINFVFFHVGDVEQPRLLVKTIRKFNPNSNIYFITDNETESIDSVTDTFRIECDRENLMTSRLIGFSQLKLNKPAVYLDTDILITQPITLDLFLGHDVYLCLRSHQKEGLIDTTFRGLDLSEYSGRTFGEIYPFLACFTYTKDYHFWEDCFAILMSLDKKFHFWYGDQEALRIISDSKKYDMGYIDESVICTLPEFATKQEASYSIHFKGKGRKKKMLKVAEFILRDKSKDGGDGEI